MTSGSLFASLVTSHWRRLTLAILAGGLSAAGTILLLHRVNDAIARDFVLPAGFVTGFLALAAVTFAARAASDLATNAAGQAVVADLRARLARRIIDAPVPALEGWGRNRILPVLNHDVDMISDVAFVAAPLAISAITVIGAFAYLIWLSPALSAAVILVLAAGGWLQYRARRRAVRGFDEAREGEDRLHAAYATITGGAKELKIYKPRREKIHGDILTTIADIRRINGRAIAIFVIANALGSALVFAVIGVLLAWAAFSPEDPAVYSGFLILLLFLRGPVEQIMTSMPAITRMQIALRRIDELSGRFATAEPGATASAAMPVEPAEIRLDGLAFAFPATEDAAGFRLGPLDLGFAPGRITMIVGDNGSGKTTLIKLLLGLYRPDAGRIVVGGRPVEDDTRDVYRQMFSAILTDYHLFDEVMPGARVSDEELGAHLDRLRLGTKVEVANGRFSTTELSTGQRKRLALIHAWVDRRPVVVFDEWTADQDPGFRHVFHTELLPALKAEGRTLIVISHDDRYFDTADRIIRMKDGRVTEMVDLTTPRRDG
ncbi:cyclic peptide export ABC transporter [Tistrella mobilis]|uniref:cyclic peptide export ABC transporter n=1 Tax=Tistrella mobilis TaxID=171437 RepID=UPI003558CF1D